MLSGGKLVWIDRRVDRRRRDGTGAIARVIALVLALLAALAAAPAGREPLRAGTPPRTLIAPGMPRTWKP